MFVVKMFFLLMASWKETSSSLDSAPMWQMTAMLTLHVCKGGRK